MIIGFTFSLEEFHKLLFYVNRNQRIISSPCECCDCCIIRHVINSVLFNSSLVYATPPQPAVVTGTGSNCVSDCTGMADGVYQSCTTCNGFVSCTNERLFNMPCAPSNPPLVWDDNKKRCEWVSATWYVTQKK